MGENAPPCEAHTLLEEEARHQHVCMYVCVVGHSCMLLLEDEHLSDPTNITAIINRSSLKPTSVYLTPFSRCYSSSGQATLPHLHQASPVVSTKITKAVYIFDPTDDKKGIYYGGPQLTGPMVHIKTYMFNHFY